MIKPGAKTKAWNNARVRLKKKFLELGITECELKYTGCMRDNFLSFAHAKKRRELRPDELEVVILTCNQCHHRIEYSGDMERTVMDVINNR